MAQETGQDKGVVLTDAQRASRRKRSIALAWAIGALCVLFYFITVFKMGTGLLNRSL